MRLYREYHFRLDQEHAMKLEELHKYVKKHINPRASKNFTLEFLIDLLHVSLKSNEPSVVELYTILKKIYVEVDNAYRMLSNDPNIKDVMSESKNIPRVITILKDIRDELALILGPLRGRVRLE